MIAEPEVTTKPRTASASKFGSEAVAIGITISLISLATIEADNAESKLRSAQVALLAVAEEPEVTSIDSENWLVE